MPADEALEVHEPKCEVVNVEVLAERVEILERQVKFLLEKIQGSNHGIS